MKHPSDTLASERLLLRRFTWDDRDDLAAMHADPEVMRFVGGTLAREKSEEMLRTRILAYYDEHPGLGVWATFERSSGAWIGLHLLNHIRGEPLIQTGYVLARPYWGRGYATEMCVRVIRYGFVELGLPTIAGITDLEHVGSQHVLVKSGLRRDGERVFPAYGEAPLAWFERDAASWRAEFG